MLFELVRRGEVGRQSGWVWVEEWRGERGRLMGRPRSGTCGGCKGQTGMRLALECVYKSKHWENKDMALVASCWVRVPCVDLA